MAAWREVTGLPDTFQSWFLIVQLHVWMTLVRFKSEGAQGAVMYKQIVTYFWHDVEYRMKLTGVSMYVCMYACMHAY